MQVMKDNNISTTRYKSQLIDHLKLLS